MTRRPYLPVLPVLLSLFVLAPAASAEPIQWSYGGQVTVTGPANPYVYNGVTSYGNLDFSNLSGTGQGSQNVGAFAVKLNDYGGGPRQYSQDSDHFAVNFRITDSASGQSGVFTFHGYLEGSSGSWQDMGSWGYGATATGKYFDPNSSALRLGNNLYKVSVNPFAVGYYYEHLWTPPSQYDGTPSSSQDTRSANLNDMSMVNVQVTHETPEPSTLALLASGITALGCRSWRRTRRSQKEQPSLQRETNTADSR